MIRPCDQCGGSGEIPVDDPEFGLVEADCLRCADMASLFPGYLSEHEREVMRRAGADTWDDSLDPNIHAAWMRGWFKPDPDTVMRWCFIHLCAMDVDATWCLAAEIDLRCADVGWVERPIRLQEVP